ncbi:MAG: tetratricopeptide repeat protein [Gemmatimonadales bacterium]
MKAPESTLDRVKTMAAAGHFADVVATLGSLEREEVEDSPTLALILGSAQARLGRPADGRHWVDLALAEARKVGDRDVEKRALVVRGGIAFVTGQIDAAAEFYTEALLTASQDGDGYTIGRTCNNLGAVSNLRGRHAEAIGSYEMAIAAFERVGHRRGMAECRHNLAITYRDQGHYDQAREQADQAVAVAESVADHALAASARRGRAEIAVLAGDLEAARRDVDAALATHRELSDPIEEAEALRIEAQVEAAEARLVEAEATLRQIIARAESHGRVQLAAEAMADLAHVLRRAERHAEAVEMGRSAQAIFARLGAEGELRKLAGQDWDDGFAAELHRALTPLHDAQVLADRGRYAELLAYLEGHSGEEIEQSPTLALLCGIGHARLGRLELGGQWAMVALTQARRLGDRSLEVRALNVSGAIALERGGMNEASHFFAQAQEQALEDSDLVTVGRCANNLAIIANVQGDFGRAVGAYTRALAAYQQAHFEHGIAHVNHNLGITYREMGRFQNAIEAASNAIRGADQVGDRRLKGQALAGRAEIRVAAGEPALARREAERALAIHRELDDAVLQAEDLRILAGALAALGETGAAETHLRDVITAAKEHHRPLLAAIAQRDLVHLLARLHREPEAHRLGAEARAAFEQLRADHEVRRLDSFLAALKSMP